MMDCVNYVPNMTLILDSDFTFTLLDKDTRSIISSGLSIVRYPRILPNSLLYTSLKEESTVFA